MADIIGLGIVLARLWRACPPRAGLSSPASCSPIVVAL